MCLCNAPVVKRAQRPRGHTCACVQFAARPDLGKRARETEVGTAGYAYKAQKRDAENAKKQRFAERQRQAADEVSGLSCVQLPAHVDELCGDLKAACPYSNKGTLGTRLDQAFKVLKLAYSPAVCAAAHAAGFGKVHNDLWKAVGTKRHTNCTLPEGDKGKLCGSCTRTGGDCCKKALLKSFLVAPDLPPTALGPLDLSTAHAASSSPVQPEASSDGAQRLAAERSAAAPAEQQLQAAASREPLGGQLRTGARALAGSRGSRGSAATGGSSRSIGSLAASVFSVRSACGRKPRANSSTSVGSGALRRVCKAQELTRKSRRTAGQARDYAAMDGGHSQ